MSVGIVSVVGCHQITNYERFPCKRFLKCLPTILSFEANNDNLSITYILVVMVMVLMLLLEHTTSRACFTKDRIDLRFYGEAFAASAAVSVTDIAKTLSLGGTCSCYNKALFVYLICC